MLTVVSDKKTTKPGTPPIIKSASKPTPSKSLPSNPKSPPMSTMPLKPLAPVETKIARQPPSAGAQTQSPSGTLTQKQSPIPIVRKPQVLTPISQNVKTTPKPDAKGFEPKFNPKFDSKGSEVKAKSKTLPKAHIPGTKVTMFGSPPISTGTPSRYRIKTMDEKDRVRVGFVVANSSTIGMHVVKVTPGLPADQAGLQVGDVIHVINGHKTEKVEDFRAIAASFRAGDTVPIKITRDPETHHLLMRIPKLTEQRSISPSPQKKNAEQIRANIAQLKAEKERAEREKLAKLKQEKIKQMEEKKSISDKMREELEKRKQAAKLKRAEMKKRQEQLKHEEVVLLQELRARRAASKAQFQLQAELSEKQKQEELARVHEEEKRRKEELEKEEERRLREEKKKKEAVQNQRLEEKKKKEEGEQRKKELERQTEIEKRKLEEALLRAQESRLQESIKKREEARKLREQERLKGEKLKELKDKPGLSELRGGTPTRNVSSPTVSSLVGNSYGPLGTISPTRRVSIGSRSDTSRRDSSRPSTTKPTASLLPTEGVVTFGNDRSISATGSKTPSGTRPKTPNAPWAVEKKEGTTEKKDAQGLAPSPAVGKDTERSISSPLTPATLGTNKATPSTTSAKKENRTSLIGSAKKFIHKLSTGKPGSKSPSVPTPTRLVSSDQSAQRVHISKNVEKKTSEIQPKPQTDSKTINPSSITNNINDTTSTSSTGPTTSTTTITEAIPPAPPTSTPAPNSAPVSQTQSNSQPLPRTSSGSVLTSTAPLITSGTTGRVKTLKGGGRKSTNKSIAPAAPAPAPVAPADQSGTADIKSAKTGPDEKQNGVSNQHPITSTSVPVVSLNANIITDSNSTQKSTGSTGSGSSQDGSSTKRKSKIVVPPGKGNTLHKLRAMDSVSVKE